MSCSDLEVSSWRSSGTDTNLPLLVPELVLDLANQCSRVDNRTNFLPLFIDLAPRVSTCSSGERGGKANLVAGSETSTSSLSMMGTSSRGISKCVRV